MPQKLKNHEIHKTVVKNQGSAKQHRKYQLEVPGLDFLKFWVRFWGPGARCSSAPPARDFAGKGPYAEITAEMGGKHDDNGPLPLSSP